MKGLGVTIPDESDDLIVLDTIEVHISKFEEFKDIHDIIKKYFDMPIAYVGLENTPTTNIECGFMYQIGNQFKIEKMGGG